MLKKLTTLCVGLLLAAGLHAQSHSNNSQYGDPKTAGTGIYNEMQNDSKTIIFPTSDIQFWCGTGSNQGVVIVGWDDDDMGTALAWGVRWNGSNTALGMLDSIAAHDPRFSHSYSGSMLGDVEYDDGTLTLSSSTNWWCYYLNGSWGAGAYGTQSVNNNDVIELSATCTWSLTTVTAATDPNASAVDGHTRVTVGTGTSGSNQTPFCTYYNSGTTEMLYTAADLGYTEGLVDTLWFHAQSADSMPYAHLNIYMGTTSDSNLSSWRELDNVQLVYTQDYGYLTGETGWEPFALTNPFYYNGSDNLVVVSCRQGTVYSSQQKYSYTPVNGTVRYLQSDSDASAGTLAGAAATTGSSSSSRSNLRLSIDTLGTLPCPRPDSLAVDSLTPYYAHIDWVAGGSESSWELTFTPAINGDSVLVVSATGMDLNNLSPSTDYSVSIRSICSDDDSSIVSTVSFRTPCVALTAADLPYSEDFNSYETGSSAAIDPCWHKGTNYSSADYPYPYSLTNIDGTNCLYFYAYRPSSETGTRIYSYAALPEYDGDLSGLMLQFDMKSYSSTGSYPERYCSRMLVGVMSDPADTATFVAVDTVTIATMNTTVTSEIYFENYSGTGRYIALMDLPIDSADMPVRGALPTYSWIYVDNIVLDQAPTCRAVTDLQVTAVDHESVTLSWTENSAATEWVVTYDSAAVVVYDNPFTLTGLTSGTDYTVGVASLCSATDTGAFRTLSIVTDCAPQPVPFFDDFESYASGSSAEMNSCYRKGTNYSTAYPYPSSSNTTATSNRNLAFYGSRTAYSYLAFPAMDTAINELILSFKALKSGENYGVFVVGTMTNANDVNTFEPYDTITCNEEDVWEEKDVIFNNYNGAATHIAILTRESASNGTQYAYVDDVMIDVVPTCFSVSDLHCVDTLSTATSLTLSWTDRSATTNYQIGYKGIADEDFTYVTATTNPYTLSGLSSNSRYVLSVTPVCAGNDTAWTRQCVGRTTCADTTALPFAENFDDVEDAGTSYSSYQATAGNYPLPACWTMPSLDSNGGYTSSNAPQIYVCKSSSYSNDGSQYLVMRGYSTTKPAVAVLPRLEGSIANLQIEFDYRQYSSSNGQLQLGVMSDAEDTSTFVAIEVLPNTTSYTHAVHDFTLDDAIPTDAQYIALRHIQVSSYSSYCSYVDNVVVTVAPTCKAPRDFAVEMAGDTARATWTSITTGNAFEIGYGISGDGTGNLTVVSNIADTAAEVVLPGGLYDMYVRTDCSGDYSPWVGPVTVAAGTYPMDGTDTLSGCGYVLVDHAGINADYGNGRRDTVVFTAQEGCVTYRVRGSVNTETNYDFVYLFDDDSDSASYSQRFSGNTTVDFTSATGFLKVVFTSDNSSVRSGFMLNVTCESLPAVMADSLVATVVNDSTVTFNWSGDADTWVVRVDGQQDTVMGNAYTASGLNPIADHIFGVASLCGASDTNGWNTISLRIAYSIVAESGDEAMGSVSGSGYYHLGDTVVLTATAAEHHHFVMWSDDVEDNPRSVVVTEDASFQAIFAIDSVTITASSADETMGSVAGSGVYAYGDTVVLTATSNTGYHFVGWNDGNADSLRTVVATDDMEFVASFEANATQGIDALDAAVISISVDGESIIVRGAAEQLLTIYDLTGRVAVSEKAVEGKRYEMPSAGVYLVKIGNYPAQKVVVVR